VLAGWAAHLGATVIGTVSSAAKAERAKQHGCAHVIVTEHEDYVARVRVLTEGRGVDVVYDGVGRDTFLASLECLRKYGMMVSFGQTSGMIEPFDPILLQHNGLYLAKFSGSTYNADAAEYQERAQAVLAAIASGAIKRGQYTAYPFADVVRAHRDLESRRSTGPLVLQV
jgi:NADPH:quinone reductase